MRVVTAYCSALYSGRGDTRLGKALRAILIKEDGSVSIHNEVGNKPLNYMKNAVFTASTADNGNPIWTFDARHESLRIELHQIIAETNIPLVSDDEGLVRDGTEAHLQEWLALNPDVIVPGSTLIQREFATGAGAVDLLIKDAEGVHYAVEVKRVAMLGAVDQVRRYVEAIKSLEEFEGVEVQGIIAALDLRPKMLALAEKRGMMTVLIPADWRNYRPESVEFAERAAAFDG